ncbi:Uncharacterised protein [Streptococcus pneumoniae]|nr:Uncharacterised protein [Streptococcus pneumoniae]
MILVAILYPAQALVTPTTADFKASTATPPFLNHSKKSAIFPAPSDARFIAVSSAELILSLIWVVVVIIVWAVFESIPSFVNKSILSFSFNEPNSTSNIEPIVAKLKFKPSVRFLRLPSGNLKTFSKNVTKA